VADPILPLLGCSIAELDSRAGIAVIGSNLRMEVPIIAHRIRKAARKGAAVALLNPESYEYYFDTVANVAAPGDRLVEQLAGLVAAAASLASTSVPPNVSNAVRGAETSDTLRVAARALTRKPGLVLLGLIAQRHPRYAEIRALAAALALITGATLGFLSEGANSCGGALAGALPHRGPGGEALERPGRDSRDMIEKPRSAYLLFGIEPSHDLAFGARALEGLRASQVVCFSPFVSAELLELADVLLPTATFAETPGTFVNIEGRWQSFDSAAQPPGEARPGWRILRVLGNELDLPACDYRNPSEVSAALEQEIGVVDPTAEKGAYRGSFAVGAARSSEPPVQLRELDVPIYSVDAVVRRSEPLQQTTVAQRAKGAA
jgi:NADH-quinone oxidoreductase subunit G